MAIINDNDRSHVIYGTNNDDTINGFGGNDEIHGRGGDDDINGNIGDDIIWGGSGNDSLNGGAGVNDLYGGLGADTFVMSGLVNASSDDFVGDFTFGADKIDVSAWGASSFDQLRFLFVTDRFGDATLNAFYNGYDHYLTISGVREGDLLSADFTYSKLGAQDITGTDDHDVLFGSAFGDKIGGGRGDDIILGGNGKDFMNGSLGNDILAGGLGDDTLVGSRGGDTLYGGAGDDVFLFRNLNDSTVNNSDVIQNFAKNADQIDLSHIDANHGATGMQDFDFIGQQNFDAAGQLRFEHDGNRTIIYANVDADTDAEFRIVLTGNVDLSAGDFILV